MNSELVPEKRVNKLGRLVTKYVKPSWFGAKNNAAEKIPQPVISSPALPLRTTEEKQLAMDVAKRVSGLLNASSGRSPSTVSTITSILHTRTSKLKGATLRRLMAASDATATRAMELVNMGLTESALNDFLSLDVPNRRWSMSDSEIVPFMEGFRLYDDLTPVDKDGTYPQERLEQCHALLAASLEIIENGDDQYKTYLDSGEVKCSEESNYVEYECIKEPNLVRLLLDPKTRDAALRIVTERGIYEADQITELISTSHRALSDGAL